MTTEPEKAWEQGSSDKSLTCRAKAKGPASPRETDPLLKDCEKGKVSDPNTCDWSLGIVGFIDDLKEGFGYKLLWLLAATQFMVKGLAPGISGAATSYIYKEYHVPAGRMTIYGGVTGLPWAMKPILGLLSDMFPIRGYNKAPYMLICSILGVAGSLCIGFEQGPVLPVVFIVFCMFAIQLQGSATDLLSEAKYAEKMRSVPEKGPALLTYVWFGIHFTGLLATLVSGLMIQNIGPHFNYIIGGILCSSVFFPIAWNYLEETPKSTEEVEEMRARILEEKELPFLCIAMLIATTILTIVGVTCSAMVTAIAAVSVTAVLIILFSLTLSPVLAGVNAFSIIQSSCQVGCGGAAFYFYTDTPKEYPEGPHFSPFFYNSVMGIMGGVLSLFGIWSYQRYMSTWRYRNVMIVTNLASSLVNLPDIILFLRLNVKWGIPDHVFCLSASVMGDIISQWTWMPQVIMLSFLCPKKMEAIMFALLAGAYNIGNTISSNVTAVMLDQLGVTPNGSVDDAEKFKNLWICSLVGGILPTFAICALYFLIPDAQQGVKILDDDHDTATLGSPLRRWLGKE